MRYFRIRQPFIWLTFTEPLLDSRGCLDTDILGFEKLMVKKNQGKEAFSRWCHPRSLPHFGIWPSACLSLSLCLLWSQRAWEWQAKSSCVQLGILESPDLNPCHQWQGICKHLLFAISHCPLQIVAMKLANQMYDDEEFWKGIFITSRSRFFFFLKKNFLEFSFKQVGHNLEGKSIFLLFANSDNHHGFWV